MSEAAPHAPRAARKMKAPSKRTEVLRRLPMKQIEQYRSEVLPEELEQLAAVRPMTRADCGDVPRPCPFVGCKYNLFLSVGSGTGNLTYSAGAREPSDVPPDQSCALDLAARGGMTLAEVADATNLTRERVRQIETIALRKLQRRSAFLEEG